MIASLDVTTAASWVAIISAVGGAIAAIIAAIRTTQTHTVVTNGHAQLRADNQALREQLVAGGIVPDASAAKGRPMP